MELERMAQTFVNLVPGDPAPMFHAACTSNPRYAFHTVAGRYVVLCFFGSGVDSVGAATLSGVSANRNQFDDSRACFFGVSVDPADRDTGRARESMPGIRFFWDFDGAVCRAYGAIPHEAKAGTSTSLRRMWIVLDPTLRVLKIFPFTADGSDRRAVFSYLEALPAPDMFAGLSLQAPILFLPNVFDPVFCRKLIELFEAQGREQRGFMADVDGMTIERKDSRHKIRRDYTIVDQEMISTAQMLIRRKVVPEIAKIHQFHVTRMERYLVGCYVAQDGGHFAPHRDNTTKGTAHRRFAVSINLNDDFDGGEISFPEYGPRGFKPPIGGAVVFSCSLLHAVSQVTRGRRYAFLPFLYDDAAAEIRATNNRFLDSSVEKYQGS